MTAARPPRAVRNAVGIGRTPIPLRGMFVAMLVLLYLPIGILFLFSFNSGTRLAFPLEGLTTEWYRAALEDEALLDAARNSFIVGATSATVATALGTMVAVAVLRLRFPGRRLLFGSPRCHSSCRSWSWGWRSSCCSCCSTCRARSSPSRSATA